MKVYERDLNSYSGKIKERALQAFKEDLGSGDVTTEAVIKGNPNASAAIIAEEDCVLAGVLEARAIFEDAGLEVSGKKDGDEASKGEKVLRITGSLKEILARERVSLNYITRMSGIATFSRRLFKEHDGRVLFLRKTAPGLLFSEKRAVALGGCLPHRMNLSDGILIKDNHLNELAKGMDKIAAVKTAIQRAQGKGFPIELEVESLEEVKAAAGADMILLDNMTPSEIKKAAQVAKEISPKVILEASGGITEDNIKSYLDAGADYVSTSIFTSAKPSKFKLELIR